MGEEIMDVVNPATRAKDDRVFHGGTFNGHPTVLAAGMATLDVLDDPKTYPYLNKVSDKLRNGFNDLFARTKYDAKAIGPGSTFNIVFTKEDIILQGRRSL
jgi:glutamate-1-semialdehyde 2,1-aminomutase